MILCNDLHKQFGDVEAVKGVSMEIPDGMFLGLLGPNGAGKDNADADNDRTSGAGYRHRGL